MEGLTKDATSTVPLTRWDIADSAMEYPSEGLPSNFGIFLPDIADFDAQSFGISDTEAVLMDPQQRMLLECTAEAAQTSAAQR